MLYLILGLVMSNCEGHQMEYMSKFMVNSANAITRTFTTCSCQCSKCGINHYCLKPQFFVEDDFVGDVPWCCMRGNMTEILKPKP